MMVGVLLLPFTLKASECDEPCESCVDCSIDIDIDLNQDYSMILGSERTVNYIYEFVDAIIDLFEGLETDIRPLIALYPNEPISWMWERELGRINTFLSDRDLNMRLACFTGMGVYRASSYEDDETLHQFKVLQNQIFQSLARNIVLVDTLLKEQIDTEAFYARFEETEETLVNQIKAFCCISKDPFFASYVSGLMDGVGSRLEFLVEDEEEEFDANTQAYQAFEEVEEKFFSEVFRTVHYFLSPEVLQQVGSDWEDEFSDLLLEEDD